MIFNSSFRLGTFPNRWKYARIKPGFHLIARIAGNARIAQNVTSDCYAELETVLSSLPAIVVLPTILASPAILASEIESFLSLRSQRSLRRRDMPTDYEFQQRSRPSFKRYFFVIFYRHCENWILPPTFEKCAIAAINGNHMTQGSLSISGHKFVRSLRH